VVNFSQSAIEYNPAVRRLGPINKLLNVKELCEFLGVSKPTIYRMQAAGELPAGFRISSRATRWSGAEIEAWLANRPRSGSRSVAA
jgi:prophage regulatory protein